MKMEHLSGLIAAPFTAFHPNGELNCDMIARQADSLVADGVKGAYICGTTGEGISCSVAERIAIMEAWSAASRGRLKLIAHTGALALGDVAVLGREAQRLGFYATSVVPPCYFKPGSVEALVEFCAAAAAAAPELPFYYYHTMNSGVNLPMAEFLKKADGRIPNLAGIKFNHHNLYEYQNCRWACDGKYDVIYGVDEFFAGALAVGAECFIGSTYNYSAELYTAVWRAFEAGDRAAVIAGMHKICQGVDLLNQHGGLAAGKAMMLVKGIECGNPRLPFLPLPEEERQEIAAALRKILES